MVGWLDRLQQRSPAVGFVIAVIYKYVDDQANYLAALITYYAFVSLFPLLLLLTTVLEFVLAGRPQWREEIVESAIQQFPVIGDQLSQPGALSGGTTAVLIGVIGALYGGLGVGQALQNAMDTVWAVPRNVRPDPIKSRVRSLLLLIVLGSALIATTLLTGLGRMSSSLGILGYRWRRRRLPGIEHRGMRRRLPRHDHAVADLRTGAARRASRGGALADAAVVRCGIRRPRRGVSKRDEQCVRHRPGTSGVSLPGVHVTARVCRDQRSAGGPAPSPGVADAVHRQRGSHPCGPQDVHRTGRSSARQGVSTCRSDL